MSTFKVDGLGFDTLALAEVVATRLYNRYGKSRSITIYFVDEFGDESVYDILEAINEPESRDPDTLEMFS